MCEVSYAQMRLSDLADMSDENKLDVATELDYLGSLSTESKYMQASTIPWLIAHVKLLETERRVRPAYMELNVRKNTLALYRIVAFPYSTATGKRTNMQLLFTHRLTDIFKLTSLKSDAACFAYFYRDAAATFTYDLHVFSCALKSNLAHTMYDLQLQALKLHQHLRYERTFEFHLIGKRRLTHAELNVPNFIDQCLERIGYKQQASSSSSSSSSAMLKNGRTPSRSNNNNASLVDGDQEMLLCSLHLVDNRLAVKFGHKCMELEERYNNNNNNNSSSSSSSSNQTQPEAVQVDYKNILYLNNSITNDNFFCLAHATAATDQVNAFILYSSNVELIDDLIREYAVRLSSHLSPVANANEGSSSGKSSLKPSRLLPLPLKQSLLSGLARQLSVSSHLKDMPPFNGHSDGVSFEFRFCFFVVVFFDRNRSE